MNEIEVGRRTKGAGFAGLLALVLITLKLANVGFVAEWSWWTVLSPLWIPMAAGAIAIIVGTIVQAHRAEKRQRELDEQQRRRREQFKAEMERSREISKEVAAMNKRSDEANDIARNDRGWKRIERGDF